jgi:hypothetical protein
LSFAPNSILFLGLGAPWYHSILPVAGYAVDGNTDGYFLNKSTTHTKYEQGAWWQVDLGEEPKLNKS